MINIRKYQDKNYAKVQQILKEGDINGKI